MPLRGGSCRLFNPMGWFQESEPEERPRLLVIGCGPAGIQIVRNLWQEFDLTLVEPKDRLWLPVSPNPPYEDYYEYTPGILRGLCDEKHLETLQVPLSEALAGFQLRHVRGKATSATSVSGL
eukprot:s2148_g3.t1